MDAPDTTAEYDPAGRQKNSPRAKRRLQNLVIVAAAAALLVWFAPAIIAHSPLRGVIISKAAADFKGRVECGGASLGWFSPVSLRDLRATDENGQPLLDAAAVHIESTLFSLVLDASKLNSVRIVEPHLVLEMRDDGSNLEDALAALLERESRPLSTALVIEIDGGTVEMIDVRGGARTNITEIDASIKLPAAGGQPIAAQLSAVVADDSGAAGNLQTRLQWTADDANAGAPGGRQVQLTAETIPLRALQPALDRFAGRFTAAGSLSGKGAYEWSSESGHVIQLQNLSVRQPDLRLPHWPAGESLRAEYAAASGNIALRGEEVVLSGFSLESDIATARAAGRFQLKQITDGAWLSELRNNDYEMHAEVDLARLAAAAPQIMRIRAGTELQSGTIVASITSQTGQDGRRWSGRVESSNLAARTGNRNIVWEQPLRATFQIQHGPRGAVIEELTCQSEFLHLSGAGSLASGELSAQADLSRLFEQISQVVDVGHYRLAGSASLSANWQRGDSGELQASGAADVQGFELSGPQLQTWREERLNVQLSAIGNADNARLTGLRAASINVVSAGDKFTLALTQSVDRITPAAAWPVQCRLTGNLQTWMPRLQTIAPLGGWQAAGAVDISATASVSAAEARIAQADLRIDNLRAANNSTAIDEPTLQLQCAGSWSQSARELRITTATLQSSTLSLGIDALTVKPAAESFGASGDIAYRADLGRLSAMWPGARSSPSANLFGMAEGSIRFTHAPPATEAVWSANLKDLVYAAPHGGSPSGGWKTLWREERVDLSGDFRYAHDSGVLQLRKIDVAADSVRAAAGGTVSGITTSRHIDLKGQLEYDLQKLAEKLRPYLGDGLRIAGRENRPFQLRGPLMSASTATAAPAKIVRTALVRTAAASPAAASSTTALIPAELTAEAVLAWSSASFQGFDFARGELQPRLHDRVVHFAPLDLQVSEGRVQLTPRIELTGPAPMLRLEKGARAENVLIAPEMCQSWLKYVAPLAAEATRAEGRFSVHLEEAAAPLTDPHSANVRGALAIHSAQLGPGPLSREILWIARQVKAIVERRPLDAQLGEAGQWIALPEQSIDFHLTQGRVYHRDLIFRSGDVEIRTSGSVGLDNTLALTAITPIRDEWVARQPLLANFQGQSLQIPISGTLTHPRVDRRVLEQLGGRMLENAAGRLLEKELNRGLERLFGPQR